MKNASLDPILAEVHSIKDTISAEFKHDVSALCRYLQELDNKSTDAGRTPARPMKRSRPKVIVHRRKAGVKAAG